MGQFGTKVPKHKLAQVTSMFRPTLRSGKNKSIEVCELVVTCPLPSRRVARCLVTPGPALARCLAASGT